MEHLAMRRLPQLAVPLVGAPLFVNRAAPTHEFFRVGERVDDGQIAEV